MSERDDVQVKIRCDVGIQTNVTSEMTQVSNNRRQKSLKSKTIARLQRTVKIWTYRDIEKKGPTG